MYIISNGLGHLYPQSELNQLNSMYAMCAPNHLIVLKH